MYREASILFCNVHEYCRVIAGPAVKSTVGLLVAKQDVCLAKGANDTRGFDTFLVRRPGTGEKVH
jgi:hypothetical protein